MFCEILMHGLYSFIVCSAYCNLQTYPACPGLWKCSGIWMCFGQMETSKHDCNKQIPRTTHPTTDAYTQSTSSCRSNSHICCSAFRNVPQHGLIATTNLCKSHGCQRALNTSTATLCAAPLLLSASLIPNTG